MGSSPFWWMGLKYVSLSPLCGFHSHNASGFNHRLAQLCIGIKWSIGDLPSEFTWGCSAAFLCELGQPSCSTRHKERVTEQNLSLIMRRRCVSHFFGGVGRMVSWIANRLLGALLSKCVIRVGCVPSQTKWNPRWLSCSLCSPASTSSRVCSYIPGDGCAWTNSSEN